MGSHQASFDFLNEIKERRPNYKGLIKPANERQLSAKEKHWKVVTQSVSIGNPKEKEALDKKNEKKTIEEEKKETSLDEGEKIVVSLSKNMIGTPSVTSMIESHQKILEGRPNFSKIKSKFASKHGHRASKEVKKGGNQFASQDEQIHIKTSIDKPVSNFVMQSQDEGERSNKNKTIHKKGKPGQIGYKRKDSERKYALKDMITLVELKNSGVSGKIRKMLHAPSLKMFILKEVIIASTQQKTFLNKYINQWTQLSHEHDGFNSIEQVYWNTPEGFVSLLLNSNCITSLDTLLSTVGMLNEASLKHLLKAILHQVQLFHGSLKTAHLGLRPSQILVNSDGQIKV